MWRLGAWSRLREELSSDGSDAGTASEGEHRTRLAVADAHAGDVPALTEQVGPVADRGSQAVLNMTLASSPAAGSAQSVLDQITLKIKALRLDLDIL